MQQPSEETIAPAPPGAPPGAPLGAAPATPPIAQPMGDQAATGFYYSLLNFGGSKVVTILGQYALSWILVGADFGYIGLAMMVWAFGALIGAAGVREVLIRRWREFDHWATPAFW